MAPQNDMITVLHLRKGYRHKEVLRDVTFSVPSGTTFALLGSNGSGKTTTIRILTTQLKPDSGKITVAGYDVARDPRRIHESISLTGQFSAVDEALTGRENMVIMGKLRQLPDPRKDAAELLDYFGLTASADQPVSSYSGGMKRKLDIAMSLPGKPKIIFLDEPTTGLDPQSRRAMWDMIKELNRSGITVFLTTQYLEEAEQLADHIAILDKGMIIAEGTPGELKAYLPRGAVEFVFGSPGALNQAETLIRDHKTASVPGQNKLTVFTDGSNQLPRCKHSSTVLGSYVAAHSTCLSLLREQERKRGMKVCLSLFLHIIE